MPSEPARTPAVDVIVPVYRGLEETLRCLESVLASEQRTPFELVVIDDRSPEPALSERLRAEAARGRFTLLANEENLGFVRTVNRGMKLHPERDVVLLNSDTCVANDWLDRLRRAAYRSGKVATVTPFSNNATICSYPKIAAENELPRGFDVAALDALMARTNHRRAYEIPTAVGFCMFIRRDALDEIGLFDEVRFGKGYGEENDFCLRAVAKGWTHLLAADTFVFHEGSVSFKAERLERVKQGLEKIRERFPGYEWEISEHLRLDPARRARLEVDFARFHLSKKPAVLFVTHSWGGGTEKHVRDLVARHRERYDFLALRPGDRGQTELSWLEDQESLKLHFRLPQDRGLLLRALRCLGVARIHYHHLRGHDRLVLELPRELGCEHDVTVHDYYFACPQITLSSPARRYCGEPDERTCDACIEKQPVPGASGIALWRRGHRALLASARRVFAPSRDAKERIARYFPEAPLLVARHPEKDLALQDAEPLPPPLRPGEPLRVAVIGGLTDFKGADILEAAGQDALARGLSITFDVIGATYRRLVPAPGKITFHGPYRPEELASRIAKVRPHLAWFPAVWPETHCFALSECFTARLPVVATDLGAFPERLAGRAWSWIFPWDTSAARWNDVLGGLRAHFEEGRGPEPVRGERPRYEQLYDDGYLGALAPVARRCELRPAELMAACAYPRRARSMITARDVKAQLLAAIASTVETRMGARLSAMLPSRLKDRITARLV